jgi:membrane protein
MVMENPRPSLLALFGKALKRLFADEAIPLAGNIAFRTIFSVFPFLIFVTSLSGFFGSADLARRVVEFMLGVAPEALVKPFSSEVYSILTVPRAGLLSLAVLLTIWSAMGGVDSIRVCLNRAYDVKETRPIWYLYIQNVLFVIGAAALMLVVAMLLVVMPAVTQFFGEHVPDSMKSFMTLDSWRYPLAFLLLIFGLLVAHRFLPAQRFRRRDVLPGILVTVVVWVLLTDVFSWYLRNFNSFASTYASLSGIFAVMFFIYQAALALIFGGEMNRVLMLLRAGAVIPEKPRAN